MENLGDETRVGVRYGDMLLMASTDMTRIYKPGAKCTLPSRMKTLTSSMKIPENDSQPS